MKGPKTNLAHHVACSLWAGLRMQWFNLGISFGLS